MLIQEQYRVCYEAILAAGLSPATLAADPECIKKFIEAVDVFVSSYHPDFKGFDRVERVTGRDIDLLRAALRAIGKEQA